MKEFPSNQKLLKRTKVPKSLSSKDFQLGSQIVLFSRDLLLVKYADNCTAQLEDQKASEEVIAIVPSTLLKKIGNIISELEQNRLKLVACKSLFLNQVLSYIEDKGLELKFNMPDKVSNGLVIVLAFQGNNSIDIIHDFSEQWEAVYGKVVCVVTREAVNQVYDLLLHPTHNTTAQFIDGRSTCCVIKPHIIKSHKCGDLIDKIMKGDMYEISAIQLFYLDRSTCSDFFSAYNNIITGWKEMMDQLCSGPILAMEVLQKDYVKDNDAVTNFRKLVAGPYDVNIAKELFPLSIRAIFGVNNVQNAIHCTDLSEDGVAEVSYFFQLLASLGNTPLDSD